MSRRALAGLATSFFAVFACIGPASAHRTACPSPNAPNQLVLIAGSGQTARLGTDFSGNFTAQLTNGNGCPITTNLAGIRIEFDAPTSGPTGVFTDTGSRVAAVGTDAQGVATAPTFTANDVDGSYVVTARSDYGSVAFALQNTSSGVTATIAPSTGSNQSATVFHQYAQPLQALVTDSSNAPIAGAHVTFSIIQGSTGASGTFLGATQAVVTTNASGVATSPPLTANGMPGRFTAAAAAEGLSSTATYALDNHADTWKLSLIKGGSQSTTIHTPFSTAIAVRLVDAGEQPIEGEAVTFTLGAPNDSATPAPIAGAIFNGGTTQATMNTDANGIATSPGFTANDVSGTFVATATLAGQTPVTFRLHNLAARLTLSTGRHSASVTQTFRSRLTATARDSYGRPIKGLSVVFAISPNAGASGTFANQSRQTTAITGANGTAVASPLAANRTAGVFMVTARIGLSPGLAKTRLRNLATRAERVIVGAASGQSASLSDVFIVPLAVTVLDRYGNRLPRTQVSFSAPAAGAAGYFEIGRSSKLKARKVTVRTNANGIAVAPRFTANRRIGGYLVKATVPGTNARGAFALANTP